MTTDAQTSSRLPFSPVPAHPVAVAYGPGLATDRLVPMRMLAEEAYVEAAWELTASWGTVEEARRLARLARDLDRAYLDRARGERAAGTRYL